jgi:hypothetical protein
MKQVIGYTLVAVLYFYCSTMQFLIVAGASIILIAITKPKDGKETADLIFIKKITNTLWWILAIPFTILGFTVSKSLENKKKKENK